MQEYSMICQALFAIVYWADRSIYILMTTSDSSCDHDPKVNGQYCLSNGYSLMFNLQFDLNTWGKFKETEPLTVAFAMNGTSSSLRGSPRWKPVAISCLEPITLFPQRTLLASVTHALTKSGSRLTPNEEVVGCNLPRKLMWAMCYTKEKHKSSFFNKKTLNLYWYWRHVRVVKHDIGYPNVFSWKKYRLYFVVSARVPGERWIFPDLQRVTTLEEAFALLYKAGESQCTLERLNDWLRWSNSERGNKLLNESNAAVAFFSQQKKKLFSNSNNSQRALKLSLSFSTFTFNRSFVCKYSRYWMAFRTSFDSFEDRSDLRNLRFAYCR